AAACGRRGLGMLGLSVGAVAARAIFEARIIAAIVELRFALLLPLLRLGAPERLDDQRIGEDELGLRHLLDRQQDLGCLAWGGIAAPSARRRALDAPPRPPTARPP